MTSLFFFFCFFSKADLCKCTIIENTQEKYSGVLAIFIPLHPLLDCPFYKYSWILNTDKNTHLLFVSV